MATKLLRKLRSGLLRLYSRGRSHAARLAAIWFQDGISIGSNMTIGKGASLSATDSGVIELGHRVVLGAGTRVAAAGGRVQLGDDVFLGDGCIVVARTSIEIGAGTQIAEYVVIRDQDHRTNGAAVRTSGFETAPIAIGRDCWLGAKVTVLRGSRIGDGAIVGAHSLVRGDIPPHSLAVGSPAKVVRPLGLRDPLPESLPKAGR